MSPLGVGRKVNNLGENQNAHREITTSLLTTEKYTVTLPTFMPSPLFFKNHSQASWLSTQCHVQRSEPQSVWSPHTSAEPLQNQSQILNTVCTLTSPPAPILEVQQSVYATINPDSIFVPGVILTPRKVLQHFLLITCLLSSCSSALRD